MNNKITVTSPLLPDLKQFHQMLKEIWNNRWITNNGSFHRQLEKELAHYLNVPFISLFANGTIPLITALQALNITGEVITTPYSFVATSHSILWGKLQPVFVDIEEDTCNIDTTKIESAITDKTTAIMAVHCYGTPCNVSEIKTIANKHNLRVIYDAAHAFGVNINGNSVLNFGDLSTLSFHATKVFNTIEGGAIISQSKEMKNKIDKLKNFGFASETEIVGTGINGKLDEIRAAYGLLNLQQIDSAIETRKKVSDKYTDALSNINGIRILHHGENIKYNYSHYPIFINENKYGISRDTLYLKLKGNNIFARRYFYPLITSFKPYCDLPSAKPNNLPVANKLAESVLCLPLHHNISESDQNKIINIIANR